MALRAVLDHPKFTELKVRLRLPRYAVLGCLEAIWHFTGRFTPQGNIGKYSDQAIEDWVGWEGQSGELIKALVETHWIDPDRTHRLLIHDWHSHADDCVNADMARKQMTFSNGTIPSSRRLNKHERKKYKAWIESNGFEIKAAGIPQPVLAESADCLQTVCITTADNLQDGCREAADSLTKPVPVPVPVPVPTTSARSVPPEEPAATLPLVDGSSYPVSREQIDDWSLAFPGIDVTTEIKRARVWFDANPTRKKTRKGINRSLVNWLGRAQDSSHGGNGPPGPVTPKPKTRYEMEWESQQEERRKALRETP